MGRPALKRITALLLTTVFLLTTAGSGFSASPCSHHDTSAQHSVEDGATGDPVEHSHHYAEAASPGSDSHDHEAAPCTCIGGCLPGAAGLLTVPAVRLALASGLARDVPLRVSREDHPRVHLLPHVLPFAQAPPAA